MKRHVSKAALLVAGAAVVVAVAAPAAQARPQPECEENGDSGTCQTSGSVSIKAKPGTVARPANQVPGAVLAR